MQFFSLATRLCFGSDALGVLKTLNAGKTLLVTDSFFSKSGKAGEILALCGGQGRIFDSVQPDPSVELVARGVKLMQEFAPEVLLALGGGSVMDCAKAMLALGKSRARFIAIPTTSGSGSEVTSFAILTHGGVKHPLVDEALCPELAILDESLLAQLPPSLIAETGMDVLSHCLEAVAAKNASAFTHALASSAFRLCLRELPKSYAGELSARAPVHQAATMAGLAFDRAGLGVCHALSHALGGAFHLAHGRLNGIFLPHVVEFNLPDCPAYGDLAALCGFSTPRALMFALRHLRSRLNLPESLSKAGLERSRVLKELDALSQAAAQDPCCKTNPRPVTAEDCAGLIRRAL